MNSLHAIILGIVEGFTEFLPISSTAHLILASRLFRLADTNFLKSFLIVIQFGAILPVLFHYIRHYFHDHMVHRRVIIAFLPTAVIGFLLYKVIKYFFLDSVSIPLIALFTGGIILIAFEYFFNEPVGALEDIHRMSYAQAFLIGCAQSVAVIPGVSRSAATILGGMWLGISRTAIVEFSFLLAVPTLAAASGYDLLKNHTAFTTADTHLLLIGFLTAAIFAQLSISFLLKYIKTHSFTSFGVYRIIVAILFALVLWGR